MIITAIGIIAGWTSLLLGVLNLRRLAYRRGRRDAASDIRAMYLHSVRSWPMAESCAKIAEGGIEAKDGGAKP